MPFTVMVDDNYHYMDESERYKLGSFATLEDAIGAAKKIVDEYLSSAHQPGFTAAELYESYVMFGEDPFIVSSEVSGVPFSARDYARERCALLCAPGASSQITAGGAPASGKESPNPSTVPKQLLGLAGWLVITFTAAAIGGLASADAGSFYLGLARPDWAPPAWLFAPVWTALYLLMGVAAWLVWSARGFRRATGALSWFMLQLAANALWTWLFFVWHLGAVAVAEILVLCALILCTVVAFWRVRPLAAALLLPYLVWVGYASALAYALWQRNPQFLS